MTYKPTTLDDIVAKAKRYGLDNSDIGMIGACWGDKFGEYYDTHPGIYKQPRNQRLEEARAYANKETISYMKTILTARGLP